MTSTDCVTAAVRFKVLDILDRIKQSVLLCLLDMEKWAFVKSSTKLNLDKSSSHYHQTTGLEKLQNDKAYVLLLVRVARAMVQGSDGSCRAEASDRVSSNLGN